MKTIVLLALRTAHRVQTFSLISLDNIITTPNGIIIRIPNIIKSSRPGNYQPLLDLPFFRTKPELCMASSLLEYIKITKEIRGDEKKLFIGIRTPHKAVSSQTLSKWKKSVLVSCGIHKTYSAHSTRHASTSKASDVGLNIDVIKRTAGWSKS